MPIIILIALLSVARYFELGPFAKISWWWVGLLFAVAFFWFEVVEPLFGLDKKKSFDELERKRAERVKKEFADMQSRRRK